MTQRHPQRRFRARVTDLASSNPATLAHASSSRSPAARKNSSVGPGFFHHRIQQIDYESRIFGCSVGSPCDLRGHAFHIRVGLFQSLLRT